MKQLGLGLIFLVLLAMIIASSLGKLNVYSPPSEDIKITFNEVEKGNNLVGISETNVILLVMVVGAFLIIR